MSSVSAAGAGIMQASPEVICGGRMRGIQSAVQHQGVVF